MKKKNLVYLQHIRDAVRWIGEYTNGMDRERFPARHLVQDAGFIPVRYSQIIFMHTYKYTLMVSSPYV